MSRIVRGGAFAVLSAATIVALAACGSDGEPTTASRDSSSSSTEGSSTEGTSTEGTSTEGADDAACEQKPRTGPVALPTADADLDAGSAAFRVTLDDGTAKCVSVVGAPDDDAGEWDKEADKIEFEFRAGDSSAGLVVTLTDRASGASDDLPTTVPGPYSDGFIGLQVDGGYFPDGWHDKCKLTVTALSADLVSGEFTCANIDAMDGGPFTDDDDDDGTSGAPSNAKKLVSADGWFVASRN
ncbi:hypothetical protein L5G28_19120 [Gordonia sp. HY285]|uniref:hypothetical protein n=1 Tax=Gordonia liuliyuniae TaxID=2911517 RepID=UPI001F32413F|nr:hypothetical protein [Gordonia liuliyuniae]MCF8612256.1 hypothetical protein [Gordonia liuliyuniae]